MSTQNEQQLQAVEISIDQAHKQIEKSNMLRRLENNKDFKKLIIEGLLREDAADQVHVLANPALYGQQPGAVAAKESVLARMTMIGELANWCRYIHMEAESAKAALDDHRNAREEILADQLEEDDV